MTPKEKLKYDRLKRRIKELEKWVRILTKCLNEKARITSTSPDSNRSA